MRKIIVPVDFSENSWNALTCALQYFKYEKCDFYIFHAYADHVYNHIDVVSKHALEAYKEVHKKQVEQELEAVLKRIQEYYPNPKHTYTPKAVFGSLLDAVNDFVEYENIDLIVMGTKGRTNDTTITYGSHTLQMLKYVACPVLGIPSEYTYERPTNIVFPSNFMVPYKNRELKLLSCLAKSYRAPIHLLYLSNYDRLSLRQEDNKALIEYCLKDNIIQYARRDYGPITKTINTYIKTESIEMIVMVNSRHSYMEELLNQSNIDAISLNTKIPLLVFQNLSRK
jgi:nucleotide-binding universal stress UspA family protein